MDLLGDAMNLLGRAGTEARYAATLLKARGPGVAMTPPHRLPTVLRSLDAYGPIAAAIALAAASQPDHPAIHDERGAITFDELERHSNALANALLERGFEPGQAMGILARNHRGLFEAIVAAAKLGARTLLLNTDFAGPQLVDVCKREEVAVLVHDEEFTDIAAGYEPPLGEVLAWTDGDPGDRLSIDSLIAEGNDRPPPRPRHKQRIVLLTSGTTGTPKGAPRDLALSMVIPGGYLSKIPLRSGRTVLLAAPAFHAWGMLSSVLALGLGNTVVITRRFDPKFTIAALEHHGCDALITVPVLLSRLLDAGADEIRSHDLSALRIIAVSGSALDPDLANRTMDLLGDIVYNLYGSTEVAYATIATPADLRAAPGTVGRPPYGTTITLLDPEGNEVRHGETGRIFVANSIHFEGYTGGGSKETIAGMMSTGDVGHLDDEGRLFVDGRDDDMIVSGGENVFPREIEELLGAHEAISEAAVVGVDDADYGKRLKAFVVLADGADLDDEAVRSYVKSNLARYKVPREVVFLDELPRNPAGKIVKRDLPD
ncbi:MAG TPA: AMP-binding protein [Jatrophihabitantaceae bacterium]|jgi:fatty-acyl-CoA synthase|nr:AMP-binding protein [Jatrophihabitantaceae bacterium]